MPEAAEAAAKKIPSLVRSSANLGLSAGHHHHARPKTHHARREVRKTLNHLSADSTGWAPANLPQSDLCGAVLQLVARAFTAVGLIMQRMALDTDTALALWRVGLATYIATILPDMLSYMLLPQSMLALLSSVEPLLVSALAMVLVPQDAATLKSQHTLATAFCIGGSLGCLLFSPSRSEAFPPASGSPHRLIPYILVVAPVLLYLVRQAYTHKKLMNFGVSSSISCLHLPFVAASFLALGRLCLGMLGASLHAVHWQLGATFASPGIMLTTILATVCMLGCAFHVCQGVQESPPHIFVPLYCTMSSIMQLIQAVVVLRDFQDMTSERVVHTLVSLAFSLLGIVLLRFSPGQRASKFVGKPSALPSSEQHHINCLEPVGLAPQSWAAQQPQVHQPRQIYIFGFQLPTFF